MDKDGKINLITAPNKEALNFLSDLFKKGLMNPYSLKSEEVFSAEVFTMGDALFTTNWTFLSGLIKNSSLPIDMVGSSLLKGYPLPTERLLPAR